MPKIIVGVDDSERAKDAVALAARLARGTGAELLLVCAYPFDDVPGRGATTGYQRYLREDALAALERAAGGLRERDRVQTRAVAELSPPRAIQEIAATERAALIVIGSSHRGAVGRVLAGTTAERLLPGGRARSPSPRSAMPRAAPPSRRSRSATTAPPRRRRRSRARSSWPVRSAPACG